MPEEKDKTIPVRVALRIRPLNPKEIGEGCQQCIRTIPGQAQVVMGAREDKAFTYDHVYGSQSHQEELYSQTVVPLLEGFFKGYNATVLAYGQTGSGKTYSMGTAFTACNEDTEESTGVIPRLIKTMFDWIEEKRDKTEFLLKASFLEIHNEEIHDLLHPSPSEESKIAIRETQDGGIKIAGLHEITVTSGVDMVRCLEQGSASRHTGATAMNSRSSRSHAIYTITMEQKDLQGSELKKAKFHLVDLAGSERVKKTHAQGERFKEGVNINKGLLALGNVISALSDEQRKSNAHVPYRDSKLTRLLQDSLGGNSNTMMIACVSPADSNFEETLNTLRYADRARQIKNKPIVNLDPAAAELAKLRQQVQLLQMQLIQGQTISGTIQEETSGESSSINIQELAERVSQLEAENEKLSGELHSSVDQNTQMYEKVLVAELARDKMIRKFHELKSHFSSKVEAKEDETDVSLVEELHSKLHELEDSINSATQLEDVVQTHEQETSVAEHATDCDDTTRPSSPADASFVSQHALRQAELGRQLQELTKALALKEELANKMVVNDSRLANIRKEHEGTVRELEGEISRLEKEKSDLSVALNTAKTATSESKLSEKNRSRIKELEAKILELKKKQVEQQKLFKLKQQSDNTIKKLNSEIQGMKSIRVKLMRQMKDESERFRALKAQKDKEINSLKDQGRKRQFEYKKLENIHMKQQAVLKRKTEEVSAVHKRLKLALDRQKEAAEKRSTQQQHQQKQADGLLPRMKSWLSHEVEVLVSVGQAKQTLENLIEDRKVLSRQLAEMRNRQEEEDDEPAAKKMVQDSGTPEDKKNKSPHFQKKINALEKELELRSCQIAGLQQKLLDAEQGEKTKHRWNSLHTMAEAKAGLQALLHMTVAAKLSNSTVETSKDEALRNCQELQSREQDMIQQHKTEVSEMIQSHDKTVTRLKEEHEEKVLFILKQIPTSENTENPQQQTTQQLQEQLAGLQGENEKLKEQLKRLLDVFKEDSPTPAPKKKKTKTNAPAVEHEEWEDWASEESGESASEAEDSLDRDPDWVQTPIRPARRSGQAQGCKCNGKCATNICACRKNSSQCSELCGCKTVKCINRIQECVLVVEAAAIKSSSERESTTFKDSTGEMERKALVEVKNIQAPGLKREKKTSSSLVKQNGTTQNNKQLPKSRPKGIPSRLHSSTSVSSSDDDAQSKLKQPVRVRPGTTPTRPFNSYGKLRTPGTSFGKRKSVGKFHPENKRKRKLHKPVNTAAVLGVKN